MHGNHQWSVLAGGKALRYEEAVAALLTARGQQLAVRYARDGRRACECAACEGQGEQQGAECVAKIHGGNPLPGVRFSDFEKLF